MSKKTDERLARIEENLSRVLNLLLKAAAHDTSAPINGGQRAKNMAVYKPQILKLHSLHMPIGEIAKSVGLHRATVREYMKHYGVVPTRKKSRLSPPSQAEYNARLKQNLREGGQNA